MSIPNLAARPATLDRDTCELVQHWIGGRLTADPGNASLLDVFNPSRLATGRKLEA
jgi:hypothetical protein